MNIPGLIVKHRRGVRGLLGGVCLLLLFYFTQVIPGSSETPSAPELTPLFFAMSGFLLTTLFNKILMVFDLRDLEAKLPVHLIAVVSIVSYVVIWSLAWYESGRPALDEFFSFSDISRDGLLIFFLILLWWIADIADFALLRSQSFLFRRIAGLNS